MVSDEKAIEGLKILADYCIEHKCLDCKCSSPHYHHFNIYDYILGSIAFIKDSVHNFNAFIINKNKNRLAKIGNKNDKI